MHIEHAAYSLKDLITDRFPLPRFIVCDAGGSQARFLLSKLNPSTTHTTGPYGGVGATTAQTIFTDDVSLQTFMDHLMKYVVPLAPASIIHFSLTIHLGLPLAEPTKIIDMLKHENYTSVHEHDDSHCAIGRTNKYHHWR